MRQLGFIAIALVAVACGPDPNAQLPGFASSGTGGSAAPSGTGGAPSGEGGGPGNGGATTPPAGTGGHTTNPFGNGGATTPTTGTGGVTGKGGATGTGGLNPFAGQGGSTPVDGGSVSSGGRTGTGGSGTSKGGSTGASASDFVFPEGTEPCTPTMKDVSGGHSDQLGAGAACFRTADEISDWSCSGADDRTVKVNGTAVTKCGTAIKKAGSFYYFDFTAGANAWATVSWWCSNCGGTGARALPTPCGQYPAWESGATVAGCSGSTPTTPSPAIDAGM